MPHNPMDQKEAQRLLTEMEAQAAKDRKIADVVLPWIETAANLVDEIQTLQFRTVVLAEALEAEIDIAEGIKEGDPEVVRRNSRAALDALADTPRNDEPTCPKCATVEKRAEKERAKKKAAMAMFDALREVGDKVEAQRDRLANVLEKEVRALRKEAGRRFDRYDQPQAKMFHAMADRLDAALAATPELRKPTPSHECYGLPPEYQEALGRLRAEGKMPDDTPESKGCALPDGWRWVDNRPSKSKAAKRILYATDGGGRSIEVWRDQHGDFIEADSVDVDVVQAVLQKVRRAALTDTPTPERCERCVELFDALEKAVLCASAGPDDEGWESPETRTDLQLEAIEVLGRYRAALTPTGETKDNNDS